MNGCVAEHTIVIGWGNDLRGDDGAGRRVADALDAAARPGIEALSLHQLTPELAHTLAAYARVIFVDAVTPAEQIHGARCTEIFAPAAMDTRPSLMGHASTPEGLLAMARDLYGATPRAWVIGIPARRFGLGAALSAATQAGIREALMHIEHLCRVTVAEPELACCN